MKKLKIHVLDVIITPNEFPLEHSYYSALSSNLKQELPGRFFRVNTLRSKKMFNKLRVLSNNFSITVITNINTFNFNVSKGLCTDLGTVPLIGEPFVDGDSGYMFIPSILHDILYIWGAVSNISFELATELLCALMRYYRAKKISQIFTKIGLFLGKKYYKKDSDFYRESRKYCSVTVI